MVSAAPDRMLIIIIYMKIIYNFNENAKYMKYIYKYITKINNNL